VVNSSGTSEENLLRDEEGPIRIRIPRSEKRKAPGRSEGGRRIGRPSKAGRPRTAPKEADAEKGPEGSEGGVRPRECDNLSHWAQEGRE
jgi:hypothetical protein